MGSRRNVESGSRSQVSLWTPVRHNDHSTHRISRDAKRGLWALRKFESPGDFKARMKLKGDVSEERPEKKSPSGWIALVKRLIRPT